MSPLRVQAVALLWVACVLAAPACQRERPPTAWQPRPPLAPPAPIPVRSGVPPARAPEVVHDTPPSLPPEAYPEDPPAASEVFGTNHRDDVTGAPPAFQRGEASFYHDNLAGRPTASGEPYDPAAMTAAHRSLPFGTVVDVVRRDGRWARVRINDRGPFVRGRVIDLSRRAAEHVGLFSRGVAPVTLFVVSRPAAR